MRYFFILIMIFSIFALNAEGVWIHDAGNPENNQAYSAETLKPRRKRLYFDAGMSVNDTRLNFASTVSKDGFDGEKITYLDNYSIPNLNARLGYRVNNRFILVSDFQTIGIRESFYVKIGLFMPGMVHVMERKVDVEPVYYFGGGFLFYPHQRFQLGVTIGDAVSPFSTHGDGGSVKNPDLLGLGYSLSLAYDIPMKNMGLLVGCGFFYAPTKLELQILLPTTRMHSMGLFTKIRY